MPLEFTLRTALAWAVSEADAPGGVACAGDREGAAALTAYGLRQLVPEPLPAAGDTVYDLASVTKGVATTTAVMLLRDMGRLDLDAPVSEWLPVPQFSAFTPRQLLNHTAGFMSGYPYYRDVASGNEMLMRWAERGLRTPPGFQRRYSDVSFILLGRVVEMAGRDRLDRFCRRRIFEPLGMNDTAFNPPERLRDRAAPTEDCAWRERVVQGAVHDENAYAMGGVSGHAGLFSTARDLAAFCRALLNCELHPEETLREMIELGQVPSYPWQGLGWQLDPFGDAWSGYLPSRRAFGHAGWTGTSVWMDYETGLYAVLLGNTCHPSRTQRDTKRFRRTFYDGVAKARYPERLNTHTGVDRVLFDYFAPLRGKRVALLTNSAAVDQLGRSTAKALTLTGAVELRRIYSPEHGFAGQAEAGAHVEGQGAFAGAPVVSLYGERKAPTPDELDEVDMFVVDLPDVGSRYYTYLATMKDCMAACAEAGKDMMVLDRPNPLGGAILEGPVAEDFGSPVCCAPIPARHGMTLGEAAAFFRGYFFGRKRFGLYIGDLDNWRREFLFDQCALPWVPPSPNIPTPETALLYAGMCLFEGTNLNEGRGTDIPFHVVGAPWLDPEAVVRAARGVEGLRVQAVAYTPRSLPGRAARPRFQDEECGGVRIHVTHGQKARPFTLALELLDAIRRTHGADFAWRASWFDTLAGGATLRKDLEAGKPVPRILAGFEPGLAAFDTKRPKKYE